MIKPFDFLYFCVSHFHVSRYSASREHWAQSAPRYVIFRLVSISFTHILQDYITGTEVILRVLHYDDVIMTMLASQITSLTVVYSIVYSDVNQRKHQSSASLAFVWGNHRGPVNFPHKWPVTRKMFPFDDVIMMS